MLEFGRCAPCEFWMSRDHGGDGKLQERIEGSEACELGCVSDVDPVESGTHDRFFCRGFVFGC